ncbi:endonuclease MutS2 [Geovibrio ferrireducens]|uniref:endonuclease MutS2 n=1 Tax=Geovibrio ferrireducens TaxID=46201 RepID=UPI0022472AD1|nr:Smr/MutS family protein [Geovibrio ferrireducens]
MTDSHIESLEFPLFRQYLRGSFVSSLSASVLEKIEPFGDCGTIKMRQDVMEEALSLVKSINISIQRDEDYLAVYPRINDPLAFFEPQELMEIRKFLMSAAALKASLIDAGASHMKAYLRGMSALTDITSAIGEVLNDKGDIRDDASVRLKEIRNELQSARKKIHNALNSVLYSLNAEKFIQELVITERSGRFTLPCKSNFRQYIDGIVHDRSASGQTLFVEPESTVSMNNTHHELKAEERKEIFRILSSIIRSIYEKRREIRSTTENYGEVAFLLETAQFYKSKPHCMPVFGSVLEFDRVHHPIILLEKKGESVPLNIRMEKGEQIGVISGPNTGGKTAALKSLGLNHIIASCGLPLMGRSAKLYSVKKVLADIGDHQSLVMDLSTFSSHMVNIRDIINAADEKSLVLMDELGTGTEPREGAAIAVAVCESLAEKGAVTFVTTHFAEIKNFALSRTDSAIFAVEFDYKTFEPKYSLQKGVAGKSDPLVISKRLGFPETVVKRAEELIEEAKNSLEIGIEEVNRLKSELIKEKETYRSRRLELLERQAVFEEKEKALKQRLDKKETELLEEAMRLFERAKRLAGEKQGKIDKTEALEGMEKSAEKLKELKKKLKPVRDIQEGDIIFLDKYEKSGRITAIEGSTVSLDLGGLKIKMKRADIIGKKLQDEERVKDVKLTTDAAPAVRREILLVGKRVEEAIDELDKFMDESLLSGFDKIYIVHGRGTGQLRRGLHDYMRHDRRVKRYAVASNEEGGQAVTIAEF